MHETLNGLTELLINQLKKVKLSYLHLVFAQYQENMEGNQNNQRFIDLEK